MPPRRINMTGPVHTVLDTSDTFSQFYDFVSRSQNIEKRMESFEDYRSYHYKDLFYIRRNLLDSGPCETVLDLGCCGTVYPRLFDLDRITYTAVDISNISINRMRNIFPHANMRWVVDDVCELQNIEDESVDLILATQVLEHLPSPDAALTATLKKLRTNGRLMIGTESSLFVQRFTLPRFLGWFQILSFYLGSIWSIHGVEPLYQTHRETHTFTAENGCAKTVSIPHGRFHPLYWQSKIEEHRLPAKIIFLRVTGDTVPDYFFAKLGAKACFKWYEIKSRVPLLRLLGSQVFLVIEKTGRM